MSETLLQVRDLKVYYPVKTQSIIPRKVYVKAVDGISFDVRRKEAFGIVGESGCGKSTTGHAIVGLLKPTSGQILFEGQSIVGGAAISKERAKKLQIIFQDPYSSLDPRMTTGDLIAEPMKIHNIGTPQEREEKVRSLLQMVGLDYYHTIRYPHEFSGGQRQRVNIARALAMDVKLLVCDEPVSALDVSVQAQVLNLLKELKDRLNLTYIFISHDLSVVKYISDRIIIMYLGRIMEMGNVEEIYAHPAHPYTQALFSAIPPVSPFETKEPIKLTGEIPSPLNMPPGCPFCNRCPYATAACREELPVLREVGPDHQAACLRCQ